MKLLLTFPKQLKIAATMFLLAMSSYCTAQMSLNVITPVCPGNTGSVSVSFTGLSYPFTLYYGGSHVQSGSVVITGSPQTLALTGTVYGGYDGRGTVASFSAGSKYLGVFPVGINFDFVQSLQVSCSGGKIDLSNLKGGTAPYSVKLQQAWTSKVLDSGAHPLNLTYNKVCGQSFPAIITIQDAAGCYTTLDSLYVSCNGLDIQTNATTAACTDGTAEIVSVTGGTKPYTYLWQNSATTAKISGLMTGSYNCEVADSNGCKSQVYTYVPQNPNITANFTNTPATCTFADASATVFPAGGTAPYTYLWDNSATTQTTTTLTGGAHTVLVTDANGCIARANIKISINSPINITYATTPSACTSATGTALLTVVGGTSPYTYKWYGNSSTTATLSNVKQGGYSFMVTDVNGCERFGTVQVEPVSRVNGKVSVKYPVCPATTGSATVVPAGSASPFTYLWSNSSTSATISGVSVGNYTCKIKDANQCEETVYAYIAQTSPVNIGIQTTPSSCLYTADGIAIATASGGTSPYTYKWENGNTTYKATGLMQGYYYLEVRDANNCPDYREVYVAYDVNGKGCFCTLNGKVYNDINGNCTLDGSENGIGNVMVGIGGGKYAVTDDKGNYSTVVPSGSYTLEQVLPSYTKLASCETGKYTFSVTASNTCVHTVDFADSQTMYHDIQIFTTSQRPPIPGNEHIQNMVLINKGNYNETKIMAKYQHDGQLVYGSSNPSILTVPDVTKPNNYEFGTPLSLNANSSQTYSLRFYTPTNIPMSTRTYMFDTAAYDSPIYTYWMKDEETPWNNRHDINPIVVSSYDPNYKEVYPRGSGDDGQILLNVKDFRYVIHFENNGTAPAQKIVVIDTLDQDLDIKSFKTVYASHKVKVDISKSRIVTFTFDNINLDFTPKGVENPMAQGMVAFNIKANSAVTAGTRLASNAGIYFDYNEPVFTNTPLNTYVTKVSVDEANISNGNIKVYPNPAGDMLNLVIPANMGNRQQIEIFNMQGQAVMKAQSEDVNEARLMINNLDYGVYYIRVTAENGQVAGIKFIKQ